MTAAAIPLMVGGSVLSGAGKYGQGIAQNQADQFQAAQLQQNAGQAQASSQVAALNQQRDTALMVSRARAVAAASGGGATDSTVSNIMARIAGEGAYRSNVDLYEGNTQARAMNMQADALKFQGQQAEKASDIGAVSSLMSGSAAGYSMYSKYGGDVDAAAT